MWTRAVKHLKGHRIISLKLKTIIKVICLSVYYYWNGKIDSDKCFFKSDTHQKLLNELDIIWSQNKGHNDRM